MAVLSEDFIRELIKSVLCCCHSIAKTHHWKACAFSLDRLKHSFWWHFFVIKVKAQAELKVIMQKLYKVAKIPKCWSDSKRTNFKKCMTCFLLTSLHNKFWISSLKWNKQHKRNITELCLQVLLIHHLKF